MYCVPLRALLFCWLMGVNLWPVKSVASTSMLVVAVGVAVDVAVIGGVAVGVEVVGDLVGAELDPQGLGLKNGQEDTTVLLPVGGHLALEVLDVSHREPAEPRRQRVGLAVVR